MENRLRIIESEHYTEEQFDELPFSEIQEFSRKIQQARKGDLEYLNETEYEKDLFTELEWPRFPEEDEREEPYTTALSPTEKAYIKAFTSNHNVEKIGTELLVLYSDLKMWKSM